LGAADDRGAAVGTKVHSGKLSGGIDCRDATMLRLAIIFLIIALIAGALGLVDISTIARRISMALFALFFLIAAVLFGLVVLVGEAIVP
jgi:uncharacterized membrane protein YtjA (UPF0391 family)